MAARSKNRGTGPRLDESGQGMVEFMLLLPVIIGMVVVLVRVNSAITTSIVNQKYARMMLTRLSANGSVYPVLENGQDFLVNFANENDGVFFNRMIIGVAQTPISETDFKPDAHTQLIARSPALSGGPGPTQQEPVERGIVRVRTTVEMCTQANYVDSDQGKKRLSEEVMNENMVLDFCAAPERGANG